MSGESTEIIIEFIIICTLLLLLLSLFISFLTTKYKQRQVSYQKDIDELKINYENELLRSRISVQDQTFQKISREIHDNIGQKLSLAKLQISDAIVSLQLNENNFFQIALQTLTSSISDLRDLSRSLSADYIAVHGLIKALENEIFQLNRTGYLHFNLKVTGEPGLISVENEIVAFRIIQESLSNILKHADASNVFISVYYSKNAMTVQVKDDGHGFDTTQVYDSNGLTNIKKRAESIHAELQIISAIGNGTEITIKIPYHESPSQ